MKRSEPILIGPPGAGKTTTGNLLAEQLGIDCIALDKVRFEYYRELDYDEKYVNNLRRTNLEKVFPYWERFNAHAVKRLLEDYKNCIFDFGAIHSVYKDQALFEQIQKELDPFQNIFFLIPVSDNTRNIEILFKRVESFYNKHNPQMWLRIIDHFVTSSCNSKLAKYTIYTDGKHPQDVAQEIITILNNAID